MNYISTVRRFLLVFFFFLSISSIQAQIKENRLLLPELMDFMLMKCDFNAVVKDQCEIEAAINNGMNAVVLADEKDKALSDYAKNMGLVVLSKYTISKYKHNSYLKGKPTVTLVFARERSDGYIRNAIIDNCYVEFSNDTIYGDEKWLTKLINSSLDFRTRLINGNRLLVDVINKSGIPFYSQITDAESLQPDKSILTIKPDSKTTFFLEGNKIERSTYNLAVQIRNALTAKHKELNQKIEIPGMPYSVGISQENRYEVIPFPKSLEKREGEFLLNKRTCIILNSKKAKTPVYSFAARLSSVAGLSLKIKGNASREADNVILFSSSSDESLGKEGYKIKVSREKIEIEAREENGFFYAIQTLMQLMPAEIYSGKYEYKEKWNVPAVLITDVPRFEYRGLHLDVGRHMYPVSFIKKYIDLLAMQKMNMFHWHLTEDQGWRIEIKKYPKLTQVGSVRKETIANRYSPTEPGVYDSTPYKGFYTQEEIKEIVEYAKERCVTVIPEIDLPGHMLAALAAYPELGCTGGPYEVGTRWGIYDDVLCAGNEKIYSFIEDVMKEVFELFPSEYIHIGGDECPKTKWQKCPKCQAKIKAEGLKDEHELQSYVIRRMEKFLNANGKKLIGWDEILEGGVVPNATLMSWRGVAGGITAAKSGHPVIMTPNTYVYLDHYQANMDIAPLANGRIAALEWTYSYNPIPAELTKEEALNIKGVQANVWTEYMRTPEYVEYMVYPRANAVAEIGWSQEDKIDWKDYLKRLQCQFERWRFYGLNFATHYKK